MGKESGVTEKTVYILKECMRRAAERNQCLLATAGQLADPYQRDMILYSGVVAWEDPRCIEPRYTDNPKVKPA